MGIRVSCRFYDIYTIMCRVCLSVQYVYLRVGPTTVRVCTVNK